MQEITFNKVEPDSIEALREMANIVFPITYGTILTKEQIDYMLEMMYSAQSLEMQFADDCKFFIFQNEGKNVGFASIQVFGEYAKLHKIYFMPDAQGKGYGKLFLNFITSLLKSGGVKSLELNVNRFNNARIFYEKNNFSVVREERNEIGEGYFMDDYVMELKL